MKKDDSKYIPIELVPCDRCGRKFQQDRLEAHGRVCKAESKGNNLGKSVNLSSGVNKSSNDVFMQKLEKELQNSGGNSNSNAKESASSTTFSSGRPLSLVCFLCSKEYGTSSLEIHIKTCKDKYLQANPNSDPDSMQPEILTEILADVKAKKIDPEKIEMYNKQADKNFKDVNLHACPNCGRKFLQDRLEVHIKGCKPKEETGKSGNKLGLGSNTSNNNSNSGSKSNRGGNSNSNNPLRKSMGDVSTSTKLLEEKLEKQLGKEGGSPNKISTNTNTNLSSISNNNGGKPLFLVCFICGREFGKHSIEIHLKTCNEKMQTNNTNIKTIKPLKLPEELESIFAKLSLNEEVSPNEIVNYNEVANKIFKEKTMKACPGCKRRFMPDRLEVHLRSCKGASEGNNNRSMSPKMISRPMMQMCPLCGREYGSLSLPIHMKKCRDVFVREQAQLPKNQRRDPDKIIEKYNESNKTLKSKGEYNIENMNDGAYEIWSKDALVPCEKCGRTFLPDRLQVHLRSCKGKK